jgi:hypothetical protein
MQLQLGGHVRPEQAYRHNIVRMHRFDSTWPQHRRRLASTSASKAPTSAHLAPTSAQLGTKMAQLGPNLGPCGGNFGPSCSPYGFEIETWPAPIRNPQNARFHWYFPRFVAIDDAWFEAMSPMLCLRWAQIGVKLPPKGPKLPHFGRDSDFHVHHMASIWSPSGSLWGPPSAQHDQLAPTWAPVGSCDLGPN